MPIQTIEEAQEWLANFTSEFKFMSDTRLADETIQSLRESITNYLNQVPQDRPDLHGLVFNRCLEIWTRLLAEKRYILAETLWWTILRIVRDWENQNHQIHKGAAYYYWGGTAILGGNIDRGFLLIHKAVEEDRITYNQYPAPDTPAYKTITLQNDPDQTWFFLVTIWRDYLERLYNQYPRCADFNFQQFESHFFVKDNIDEMFYFTFTLARLHNDSMLGNSIQGDFASQYRLNLLFDLALVIDSYITKKDKSLAGQTFHPKVAKLLNALTKANFETLLTNLNKSAKQSEASFETEIAKLLNERNVAGSSFPGLCADAAVTYCVRNFSGHRVGGPPTISNQYDEILQSVFNTLFLAVELFP